MFAFWSWPQFFFIGQIWYGRFCTLYILLQHPLHIYVAHMMLVLLHIIMQWTSFLIPDLVTHHLHNNVWPVTSGHYPPLPLQFSTDFADQNRSTTYDGTWHVGQWADYYCAIIIQLWDHLLWICNFLLITILWHVQLLQGAFPVWRNINCTSACH